MTLPGNPPVPTDLVHHIGIAVVDLTSSMDFYHELFGLEPGPIIVRDDIKVRGCFIPVGETNLELLQGTDPGSMISEHISRSGEGLHHVCFEVGEVARKAEEPGGVGYSTTGQSAQEWADGRPDRVLGFFSGRWSSDRTGAAQPLAC